MTTPVIGLARARSVIHRASLAGAAWLAVACSGPSTPVALPTPPDPRPRTEDLTIDMATTTLQGTLFVPEGLAPPPMLVVRPSRKTTLDKQRAAWKKLAADAKAPLARKATEAQVLATLLFDRLRGLPADAPTRGPLLDEARAALAAVHDAGKDKTDRTTLEMAAALALGAGDRAGAERYLDELIARFPDSGADSMARAQLAYVQLVAGKDDEATTALAGQEPLAARPDLAYVIAWLRFRAGNGPGAAAAIALAASGWKDDGTRPALTRDYLIMTTRGGVAPTEAAAGVTGFVPDGPARSGALLDLAQAYDLAGRPDDAAAAIELALAQLGATLAPIDQLAARRTQAELARKSGHIADLGARWAAVTDALARCKDCDVDVRHGVATELAKLAYELHTIYVTSGDPRHRAAAMELYRLHAGLGDADGAAVAAHARELGTAHVPEDGSQYHEAIRAPIVARFQSVLACYEARLQGTRTLGGPLTVRLEVDQRGQVSGVTTEPAGGLDGMAAVATCIERDARTWTLPSRPRPGVARISLPFVLGALTQ